MKRKQAMIYLLLFVVFVAFSYALIYGDRGGGAEPRIQEVSVILNSRNDNNYIAIKQGIDQASIEAGVDVSYISLTQENSFEEQKQLIQREIAGGASAVIIDIADEQGFKSFIEQQNPGIPIVAIVSGADSDRLRAELCADNEEMARALSRKIAADMQAGGTVILLDSASGGKAVRERLAGVKSALVVAGFNTVTQNAANEQQLRSAVAEAGEGRPLLAPEPYTLELAAQILSAGSESGVKLYGFGSSAKIAGYLERGVVEGTIVQNDFSIGYLSLFEAVSSASKPEGSKISFMLVSSENMYDTEVSKLLFPYVR